MSNKASFDKKGFNDPRISHTYANKPRKHAEVMSDIYKIALDEHKAWQGVDGHTEKKNYLGGTIYRINP